MLASCRGGAWIRTARAALRAPRGQLPAPFAVKVSDMRQISSPVVKLNTATLRAALAGLNPALQVRASRPLPCARTFVSSFSYRWDTTLLRCGLSGRSASALGAADTVAPSCRATFLTSRPSRTLAKERGNPAWALRPSCISTSTPQPTCCSPPRSKAHTPCGRSSRHASRIKSTTNCVHISLLSRQSLEGTSCSTGVIG